MTLPVTALLFVASAPIAAASVTQPGDSTEQIVEAALVAVDQELTPAELSQVPPQISVTDEGGTYHFASDTLGITPLDADSAVVLARASGIQALAVLDEGDSAAEFRLDAPTDATVLDNGTGFDVVLAGDGFAVTIATISAPWAVDARGTELPTSYDFSDGLIRQHVVTDGAVYPIVADPLITLGLANAPQGPGPYLNLTGQVLNTMYAAVLFAAKLSPAVVCVTLDKIPHATLRNVVRALCGLFGVATVTSVIRQISAALRSSSWRNGQCYQMRVPGGGRFVATSARNCA